MRRINVTVNGSGHAVDVPDNWTLVQLLRDILGMRGTEEGCGEGVCGSCTVLVDGELARACLTLAVRLDRSSVLTVEGLATGGRLNPLQEAFAECGAVQCGFCTPGFLMAATKLLREEARPARETISRFLAGNICRCGSYPQIIDAVVRAAEQRGGDGET